MAVAIQFFNSFVESMGDGSIDMDTDTFKTELVNGYSYSAAHTQRSNWSGSALGTGNGYTTGGASMTGTATGWSHSGGTTTWNADDVSWTASGGSIGPATGAVVYSDTSTNDLGVCHVDFDDGGAGTETAGDGTQFVITWNASGIFTVS